MKRSSVLQNRKMRRMARVRSKIQGSALRPRLAVRRSLFHIYAQLIDDAAGRTLVAVRDMELAAGERKGKKKTEIATLAGQLLADRAKEKKITQVVFDRRDKRYHGRVQAFAEGARKGGLIF